MNVGTVLHANLVLLEFADPIAQEAALADPALALLLGGALSPTLVAAAPERVPQILVHLRRLGHFPRLVTPGGVAGGRAP